jgi:hypothetical protein
MAQGYDGFAALKNRKFIIDDENGQIMSSIIRSFLLGKLPHVSACVSLTLQARCISSGMNNFAIFTKRTSRKRPIKSFLKLVHETNRDLPNHQLLHPLNLAN